MSLSESTVEEAALGWFEEQGGSLARNRSLKTS